MKVICYSVLLIKHRISLYVETLMLYFTIGHGQYSIPCICCARDPNTVDKLHICPHCVTAPRHLLPRAQHRPHNKLLNYKNFQNNFDNFALLLPCS